MSKNISKQLGATVSVIILSAFINIKNASAVNLLELDPNNLEPQKAFNLSVAITKIDNGLARCGSLKREDFPRESEFNNEITKCLENIANGTKEIKNLAYDDSVLNQVNALTHSQRIDLQLKFYESAASRNHASAAGNLGFILLMHEDPAIIHNDENDLKGISYLHLCKNLGDNGVQPILDALNFEKQIIDAYKSRYSHQIPMNTIETSYSLYSSFSQDTGSKIRKLAQGRSQIMRQIRLLAREGLIDAKIVPSLYNALGL